MFENYEKNLISVIVPCYNAEKSIKRCIDSIVNNSYSNLEIICVNDGSTDLTLKILLSMCDSRLKIINQLNQGISEARNAGLRSARGEYISFIDSDDWVDLKYFETLIDSSKWNNAMVVMCEHHRVENFCILNDNFKRYDDTAIIKSAIEFLDHNQFKQFVWGKLYKREFIKNIFFDKKLLVGEDKVFNILCSIKAPLAPCVKINYKGYYYYNSPLSTFRTLNSEKALPLLFCLNEILEMALSNIQPIIAIELLKSSLSFRYLLMFQPDYHSTINVCNDYIDRALNYLKKSLSLILWLKYFVFAKLPFSYRLFRILTDRSMLKWEKKQKNK